MSSSVQQALSAALDHHQGGRLVEAEVLYLDILKVDPNQPDALHYLGMLAHQLGHSDTGVELIKKAIAVHPGYFQAYNNLGNVFQVMGETDDALQCFIKAIAIKPDYAEAFFNLANVLQAKGHLDDAVLHYEQAISLKSDYLDAINNLGSAYQKLGRAEDAVAQFEKIIQRMPNYAKAHINLGLALAEQERYDETVESYQTALRLEPTNGQASYNLSLVQLVLGDFENGWANYARRWGTTGFPPPSYDTPLWTGQDLQGKTVLVNTEQGHGDILQFVRFIPALQARGARVIFEVPSALMNLFQTSQIADVLIKPGDTPPPFDHHISLLDIPRLLDTTQHTIPAPLRNLAPSTDRQDKWGQIFGIKTALRVGLVWAGNLDHKYDYKRSIPAPDLRPLLNIQGMEFYSLQIGRNGEAKGVFGDAITDLAPGISDYTDTASVLERLDLVITVDTSTAHLSGALGCPVWTLISFAPDWRWLLERDDSPWYPSMRLFRQKTPGDWSGVIVRVHAALNALS